MITESTQLVLNYCCILLPYDLELQTSYYVHFTTNLVENQPNNRYALDRHTRGLKSGDRNP